MTDPPTATRARDVERGIRWGLVAVFVVGVRRKDPDVVVNAALSLVGTLLPAALERSFDVEFRPWQRVYADAAMLTHAVGMLGPYDDTPWWDHVTHTHSATLVGGAVHVVARRRGRDPRVPVLVGAAGAGGCWELLEYLLHAVARRLGVDPILVRYGSTDTVLDLAFDLLGAVLVLAFGDRLLENLA